MNHLNKRILVGILLIMSICLGACRGKSIEVSSSNVEQLYFHNSVGESFKLDYFDSEYMIVIKADGIKEIVIENLPQLIEIFNIPNIEFVFLWNEGLNIPDEVNTSSYIVDNNINLDQLSHFVLYNKDKVLLSSDSIDDIIDELIQIIRDTGEMEKDFLKKLSQAVAVLDSGNNTNEILYLFITENCSICEQVKDEIPVNSKLIDQFNKVIYIADHNSDKYFSDSFNVYSRYFSIDEYPAVLVYSITSGKYEVNPQSIIDKLN